MGTIQSCPPPALETGPAPANYTPFPTNRSKPRFETNHLGSYPVISSETDQYLPVGYPSTSSNNEIILLPAAHSLSTTDTSHGRDFRVPYGEHKLADPNAQSYNYVAPSTANDFFFDTAFNVDPTGFDWSSTDSFPCPPRSTEASNQDSSLPVGPNGFESCLSDTNDCISNSTGPGSENSPFRIHFTSFDESSNRSFPRPSSLSEARNQNSHYSGSETPYMTTNSPEDDGLRNGESPIRVDNLLI